MKRWGRWLFNVAAIVVILLWLAVCCLWIRGFWTIDTFWLVCMNPRNGNTVTSIIDLQQDCSQFALNYRIQDKPPASEQIADFRMQSCSFSIGHSSRNSNRPITLLPGLGRSVWNRIGFEYDVAPGYWRWFVPFWFPLVLLGLLPAIKVTAIFRGQRDSRRIARGLCMKCGYDLRATPDRCPECGTIPMTKGAAT